MYPRIVSTYFCTYMSTYQPNINMFIKFVMPCGILTMGHVSQYKIIQVFQLNVLDYFQNT